MPYFEHDGITLYYEQHGNGQPLLMLAGLASDSQSWLPVLEVLSNSFRLILMDNRGVGRSTQDCDISIKYMADDCAALAKELGLSKLFLLGHSMGGMVAMESVRRYPELFERLILVGTGAKNSARNNILFQDWAEMYESAYNPALWFRSIFSWIFSERFFENRKLVDASIACLLNYQWPQSPVAFRKQVEAIALFDATDWLDRIRIPTKVIVGSDDILLPLACSKELAERIPGATLSVIRGAAHSIHTESAEEFINEVMIFLAD
jgi:pimeloyl-ACP methyl ester carboxylesterase